jgi:hypothetical protein
MSVGEVYCVGLNEHEYDPMIASPGDIVTLSIQLDGLDYDGSPKEYVMVQVTSRENGVYRGFIFHSPVICTTLVEGNYMGFTGKNIMEVTVLENPSSDCR